MHARKIDNNNQPSVVSLILSRIRNSLKLVGTRSIFGLQTPSQSNAASCGKSYFEVRLLSPLAVARARARESQAIAASGPTVTDIYISASKACRRRELREPCRHNQRPCITLSLAPPPARARTELPPSPPTLPHVICRFVHQAVTLRALRSSFSGG